MAKRLEEVLTDLQWLADAWRTAPSAERLYSYAQQMARLLEQYGGDIADAARRGLSIT